MEFKQCEKCNNDLQFSASTEEITCSFCGTTNIFKNKKFKVNRQVNSKSQSSSSDSAAVIAAISTSEGSGGDC